ncbi:MAG: hypothetical protein LBS21_09395 [Clostridiales bacterium]|jgi:hypothetical protein|nr:hypothetical protein [Clostridiales bacterium]
MAVFYSDIWADCVNAELPYTMGIITRLATDYTDKVKEITQYGEVCHFPSFDRIGEAEEMTVGTELTPARVSMTDTTATVKQLGKAIRIYDKELIGIKGNTYGEHARQMAEAMMEKLELDIIKEIDDNAVFIEPIAGSFSLTTIQSAMNNFGDKRIFTSFAGIVANSALANSFYNMKEFTDLTSTVNNITQAATNSIMDGTNCIGFLYAIPVYLTDVGTATDEGDPKCYIIKKKAVGKIMQRGVNVEHGRRDLLKATDISCDTLYATKLLNPKGIVVIK